MQSTEKNNMRVRSPLILAAVAAVHVIGMGGAFLLAGGCRTNTTTAERIEPPPTIIMPPAPQPANAVVITPPPAPPVFTPPPPPAPERLGGITVIVKSGDSLSRIAQRYGVSSRELAQLNNISNPNKLRIGQRIVLPVYAKERAVPASTAKKATKSAAKPAVAASAKKAVAPLAEGEYEVKSGDSISKIAATLHVTQKALRAENNLQSDKLKIGQRLRIPGQAAAAPAVPAVEQPVAPTPAPEVAAPVAMPAVDSGLTAPAPAPAPAVDAGVGGGVAAPVAAVQTFDVTVEPGETLDGIATKYGVLAQDIKKLNNIAEVAPGQKIKLPLPTP